MQESTLMLDSYVPLVPIQRITMLQRMGHLLIANAKKPNIPCGTAKRVGYTGARLDDLTIYRLRVQRSENLNAMMLPMLYVVDGGTFIEYEQWLKDN